MKNRFKVSIVFMMVLLITTLVFTGSGLAIENAVEVYGNRTFDVIPKKQCYKFKNDTEQCKPKFQTWVIVWVNRNESCDVQYVYVLDSNTASGSCTETESERYKIYDINAPKREHLNYSELATFLPQGDKGKFLENIIVPDTRCSDVWMRFDFDNCDKGENTRCFGSGGRAYCP